MTFYEQGDVRIHYEEAGSGFPLFIIPGGGLNSNISILATNAPFNPIKEFKDEYAASWQTCATPTAASPLARSRSTGLGTRTLTIASVCWITWASRSSW
jgi:hypothetical protein